MQETAIREKQFSLTNQNMLVDFIYQRVCATSQKVAGSIPEEDIGILYLYNPSGQIMAP
jgi:hypothetical protein